MNAPPSVPVVAPLVTTTSLTPAAWTPVVAERIDGEMTLVLDDSEVLLKPGSVVVQRGTNHAWANRSGRPCRMLFVLVDGQYDPEIAAALARRA